MVATLQIARRARRKAEAISGFLQETLNASNPDRNLGGQPTVKDFLDEASTRLASEGLSDQPEVKAELQRIIGASYLSLGQYDLAEQNLRSALQTQARLFGQDGIPADKFYLENLPRLRAEYKKGAISADYLGPALNGFALVRRAQGDSREAERLLREELALPLAASREQQNGLRIAQAVLALTLADQGKFEEAIKIVREKIAALRR